MANYYEYNAQNLRNRIDIYSKEEVENDITGSVEHQYVLKKEGVYSSIRLVRRRLREGQAETTYGIVTHEVLMRKKSVPFIDETYRLRYKDSTMEKPIDMEILSIDYDFNREGIIYCRCEQVIE